MPESVWKLYFSYSWHLGARYCMQQIIANVKGGVQWCLQKLPFPIDHLFGQITWN